MNFFIMSITWLVMTAFDGLYLAIDVLWGLVSWFEKTWDPESQKSAVADLLGLGDPSQLNSSEHISDIYAICRTLESVLR